MNLKTTQPIFRRPIKAFLTILIVIVSIQLHAQTVTDVFPTRITTNAHITVIGTGFSSGTSVSISGITISGSSINIISENELSFQVTYSGSSDITGTLNIAGNSTDFDIDYVAPTSKVLKNGETSNVTKITEIFTTYNGFWRSSDWKANPADYNLWPNDHHDLLAFTYDGVTYSTGVNDNLLTSNGVTFNSQLFYAYTTNGVDGITHSGNYLATGDMIDGEVNEGTNITSPEILNTTIYDVLIDGVNGLDLGTGVTNFNQLADVEFYSSGGQLGAISDAAPDFLISQIAQAGSTDVYFYADDAGNVVGRPIKITIQDQNDNAGDALLAKWRLDLYNFQSGTNYGVATPISRAFSNNETRPLRMAAFRLEEFEITVDNIADINNINMVAGGTADLAFLAYNRGSFDIKTPVFTQFPVSRNVCRIPSSNDLVLSAMADVSGGATGAPEEELSYQWYKYNTAIPGANSSTYTISGGVDIDDLGTYKVRVNNDFGAVISPLTVSQGGTPVYWNGTDWELPPAYVNSGITVDNEDRGLVFSANYNQSGDLEGCDCNIPSGSNVTIPSGSTLKLYNTIVSNGNFTLEDGANLIQTKEVTENTNTGNIHVEREASDVHTGDYVFWSSPVNNYDVSGITGAAAYQWSVNQPNSGGTVGDWISATGVMNSAEGYIVGVPSSMVPNFTATFTGVPRNGTISVDVEKSSGANLPVLETRHWNLLGNPYPSSLSADEFLEENTILEGNVRLYTHDMTINNVPTPLTSAAYLAFDYNYAVTYVTYNFTGANPPQTTDGYIASGQGFFVQVDDTAVAGPVSFTNSMRFDDEENSFDNSGFFRSSANQSSVMDSDINKELVWLSLVNTANESASTLVGYVDGATNGKDRLYDAYSDIEEMSIYSLIGDSKMVIQGRAMPFVDTDEVPLGLKILSAGTYQIGIGDLMGSNFIGNSQGIYLEDTLLDIEHDLRISPYSFTISEGTIDDRFILKYVSTLSVEDFISNNNTIAFINKDGLHVNSSKNIQTIQVYDISGKLVVTYDVNSQENQFVTEFNFSNGIYVGVITHSDHTQITSKLVK